MARDADGDLPEIEILGAGPSEASVQTVVVGGGGGSDGAGTRRWWPIALAALIVVAITGALIAGGDDGTSEEEAAPTTSTTRRSTTTTSLDSGLPSSIGPVLLPPTEAWIVFVQDGRPTWTVLDLGTGEFRALPVPSRANEYAMPVPIAGGLVVVGGEGVRYLRIADPGDPIDLGEGSAAFRAGEPGRVWVVDPGSDGSSLTRVRMLDLAGGKRAERSVADHPFAAVGAGPIVNGYGQVFVAPENGPLVYLGAGDVAGTAGDRLLLTGCDESARCGPRLVEVGRDGTLRSSSVITALQRDLRSSAPMQYLLSDDGDVLEVDWSTSEVRLRWVDHTGRLVLDDQVDGTGWRVLPAFLPDGRGLVWLRDAGTLEVLTPGPDGQLVRRAYALDERVDFGQLFVVTG